MDKINLDQLLKQMDPSARMENDVREVLTEFVDDYVNQLLKKTCELAKYRGSDNIEVKDVQYAIEHYFK
ncbi:transcription initiation factor TFIID subunit A domain-containing protein [Ditylenchus destructor]|nr:transcription initiation factor TFIID subunit A domain-containing protein [Ditylenchus destructor]